MSSLDKYIHSKIGGAHGQDVIMGVFLGVLLGGYIVSSSRQAKRAAKVSKPPRPPQQKPSPPKMKSDGV